MTGIRQSKPPSVSAEQVAAAHQRLAVARQYVDEVTRQSAAARRMAEQAARDAIADGVPVDAIAKRLGVAVSTVNRWLGTGRR